MGMKRKYGSPLTIQIIYVARENSSAVFKYVHLKIHVSACWCTGEISPDGLSYHIQYGYKSKPYEFQKKVIGACHKRHASKGGMRKKQPRTQFVSQIIGENPVTKSPAEGDPVSAICLQLKSQGVSPQ